MTAPLQHAEFSPSGAAETDTEREQRLALASFLIDDGRQIIQHAPGWIRWRASSAEGVVRLTDGGTWQLLADPPGRWDRCANAAVRIDIRRFRDSALRRDFREMERLVQPQPKQTSRERIPHRPRPHRRQR